MIMKKKKSTTQLSCCNRRDSDEFSILPKDLSNILFYKQCQMLCLKLKQNSCGNVKKQNKKQNAVPTALTIKPASTLSVKCNQEGSSSFEATQKKATLSILESGNTKVPQFNPLIGHPYKKCWNKIFMPAIWFILWRSHSQVYAGIFISDASKCPRFRCRTTGTLSQKFEREIYTSFYVKLNKHILLTEVRQCCFYKPVLSLARPSFLTRAIIETRFQASFPPSTMVQILNENEDKQSQNAHVEVNILARHM